MTDPFRDPLAFEKANPDPLPRALPAQHYSTAWLEDIYGSPRGTVPDMALHLIGDLLRERYSHR